MYVPDWARLCDSCPPASDPGTQDTPSLWFLQRGASGLPWHYPPGRMGCGAWKSDTAEQSGPRKDRHGTLIASEVGKGISGGLMVSAMRLYFLNEKACCFLFKNF